MLLSRPAVVGQDGIHDGGFVAVVEGVPWRHVLNGLGQRAHVPIGHQVVPCRGGCGPWWSCLFFEYLRLVLRPVLQHSLHVCDVCVWLDAVFR